MTSEAKIEAAARQALAERHLDPSWLRLIVDFVPRVRDEWRLCCGSNCDPCIDVIAPAVDRAREILGIRNGT